MIFSISFILLVQFPQNFRADQGWAFEGLFHFGVSGGVVDIFILPQNAILKAVAAAEGKRTRFIACQFIAASNFVDFVVEGSDGLAIFADSIL